MDCGDAGTRIDAFVDGELTPSISVDVARHVGQCGRCEGEVQRLLGLRDAMVAEAERAAAALDLSGVWAHVDAAISRGEAQRTWRQRVQARRVVPPGFAWGTIAALAAGTALFLRPTVVPPVTTAANSSQTPVKPPRLPNHVYFDRLAGKDIAIRREKKSGTTMVWVNHEVERSGW
jgi:anti-sigma factor RsiW